MFSSLGNQIITPIGPGGPLVTGQNALLQNRILGGQAMYAPQQGQANAYLTAQQGAWYPYAQMNNPMMWQVAQGNPALQQTLNTMMKNLPLPQQQANGWPLPQSQPTSPFNALMQKLGVSQPQSQANAMPQMPAGGYGIPGNNAVARPPMQGNYGAPQTQPNGPTGPSFDPARQIPVAQTNAPPAQTTSAQPNAPVQPSAPQPEQGAATIQTPRATPAGNYLGGDYSKMMTSPEIAKSLGSMDVANMSSENKSAYNDAVDFMNTANLAQAYNDVMDKAKLNLNGPIAGHIDPNSITAGILNELGIANLDAPQTAKFLNAQLQASLKSILGTLKGPEIPFAKTMKYDPTMTDQARHNVLNETLGFAGRKVERLQMYTDLDDPNLNASQNEKNLLYSNYNKSYPPYEVDQNGNIASNPTSLNGIPLYKYWDTAAGVDAARSHNANWQPPGWDNIVKQAKQEWQAKQNQNMNYSDDDLNFTASKYNMTPQQVKDKLGLK